MNEVGGSESGTGRGLRAIKSSRSSANFEYDDSEWDVGIGNLIIDLDADIEKNNEANRNNNNSSSTNISLGGGTGATNSTSLSTSSPEGGGTSNPQMHIPLTSSSGNNSGKKSSSSSGGGGGSSGNSSSSKGSNDTSISGSAMEHSSVVDKGLKMKIKRTKTGTKSGADAKHEIVKNDVLGSSSSANGTGRESSGGSNSGSGYSSSSKSSLSETSSKNSHNSSHKDKEKLLKEAAVHLHDNAQHNEGGSGNTNSKLQQQQDNSSDHATTSGKVKTPRKGSTKEKKVKNSNVGNSGNSKKDEKNSNEGGGKGNLSNSSSGGGSASSSAGSHGKDNKEYFSTTVNLNVPNVIPNSSSSAFVKTTATIKVPTAPSSNSALSSERGNGGNNLHSVHNLSGNGGDSSYNRNSSSNNNSNNSVNSNSSWGTASPSKGGEKGRLSPNASNSHTPSEKSTGGSYKKARNSAAAQAAAAAADKTGSNQDDNASGSQSGSSSSASYRNQGAVLNSATDLSSSSSNFVQGSTGSQSGNNGSGFGSPKETGKGARSATTSTEGSTMQRAVQCCLDTSVGTITEIDYLGPCEPGTPLILEGIVWHETESGVLAVNMTWRGKSYVGALIDATKSDWAPPRFCDSPTNSDLEMRTPKNRGKRGRAQAATPVNEPVVADTRSANAKLRNGAKGRRGSNTAAAFVAPASPVKPDPWPKRKTRGSENESQEDPNPKNAKRPKVVNRKDRRSNSPATDNKKSGSSSPQRIECPEPNCNKKYTHINGLKYHLSSAHSNNLTTSAAEDSDSNMSTASITNASSATDPPNTKDGDSAVEPMVVDEVIDGSTSQPGSVAADDSGSAPSTPGKKSSGTPPATSSNNKVDDKIYDLSSDADLNLGGKDSNSQSQESLEPYSSKAGKTAAAAAAAKSQAQSKDSSSSSSSSDSDSKLVPENLSKDSSTASSTSSNTPTLTPRTPILTVPVVPYMSSLQNRNMVHGHVVNVPRVENSNLNSSRDSENCSPLKNSSGSGQTQKNTTWQPHAQSHVMNTSPGSSITVPLNIPMNIPEKLGGSSMKDKDKNSSNSSSSEQQSSKKNKHKKKCKDKDKERDGKSSKDKDRGENSLKGGINVPMPPGAGGPSDYSRSSGLYHNSIGSESMRSKDSISSSGDDNDSSRKNSLDNREDPQSPAYSDISDANDSGPDGELNVGGGGGLKDGNNCKGLVIPGTAEIKKDPISAVGVPGNVSGGPPFQPFFNHNLHSPYLDSLSYAATARQTKEGPEGRISGGPSSSGGASEDVEKGRSSGPIKHPNPQVGPPQPGGPHAPGDDSGRRSPKMDFHAKYPYTNPYFPHPHPYSNFLSYPEHSPYHSAMENSPFGPPPGQGRVFPGMEDREKEGGNSKSSGKSSGTVEKDDGPGNVQIKQEPMDREDRSRGKEKLPQTSAFAMNIDQDKNSVEIKSEFGGERDRERDHSEPKLVPPYSMSNSSSKHKEHGSSKESRHDRRHNIDREGKDTEGKSESMKSSRSSSSSSYEKGKGSSSMEESSEKERERERKDEGAKPTMETTGPPPPPTASAYYLPQGYLPGNPFALPFDPSHPLYRQMLVPGPYPGSPYMHPGQIPRFPSQGGPTPLPEDLSRPSPPGPPGPPSSKALDLLQHHAAQYYNSHKIHELQERALKSPSPQIANQRVPGDRDIPGGVGPGVGVPPSSSPGHSLVGGVSSHSVGGRGGVGGSIGGVSGPSAMPKPADLSKDSKPTIGPGGSIIPGIPNSDSVRTPPPTQHHVHSHTHHHTHVGIGYPMPPIIPAVSPQYSPHYGGNKEGNLRSFSRS